MLKPSAPRIARAIFYGGGSMLLMSDVFLLLRAVFTTNFVPILPILVGILTAGGLLMIIYAEQKAREEDERDHRRISRVAHQLTSPIKHLKEDLNVVLDHSEKLPAEQRLQLKKMETKANILLDNVRDVFLTLQAQEGKVAQNIRVYDICTLVKEAVDRAQAQASARNVELIYEAHCKHAPARVDRQLLLIALAHVLENAMMYTPKPGLVNIAIVKGKNTVRIIVQDRGIGIIPAEAHLVERPFARGAQAEKYDPDGIGLGVALSKLILKEFNGHLVWKDRPNRAGTQFEFIVPLAKTN